MLPIKSEIKRRFTMPPQIISASVLPGKTGNTKIAVFTRCISALPEFNQLLLDFFNLFNSRLILKLLCDSLNLVINEFSSALLVGMVQDKRRPQPRTGQDRTGQTDNGPMA